MIENKTEINRNPLTAYPSSVAGDMMYGGLDIRGAPTQVSEHEVEWRIFDLAGAKTLDDIVRQTRGRSALLLRPFQFGELYQLLISVGFTDIEVYADFERVGHGKMPDKSTVAASTFLTYSARRPA